MPRQLWIAATGFDPDFETTVYALANAALAGLPSMSVAAMRPSKIRIGDRFDSTPDATRREFFQAYVQPESNYISEARLPHPAVNTGIEQRRNRIGAPSCAFSALGTFIAKLLPGKLPRRVFVGSGTELPTRSALFCLAEPRFALPTARRHHQDARHVYVAQIL